MGRLIGITVALVVLFGAGLAVVTWILSNFEQLASGTNEKELTKGWLVIEGLNLPVTSGGALDHYVAIDLRLEINDVRREGEIGAMLPRIRDALLRDAHRTAPRRADGVDSIDLARVKDRAKAMANQVLGGEVVTRVLVTKVAKLVA